MIVPDRAPHPPPSMTNAQEGVFLFSVSAAIQRVLSFGVALILLRALSLYEYGLWKLVFSFVGIAQIFLFPSMRSILVSDISRARAAKAYGEVRRLLSSYALFQCGAGLLLGAILFAGTYLVPALEREPTGHLVRIASLLLPLAGLREIFQLTLHSHARFRALALLHLSEVGFPFLFLIVLVMGMRVGVSGVPLAYVCAFAVEVVVFAPAIIRSVRYLRRVVSSPLPLLRRSMRAHGKWASANEYVGSLVMQTRIWVIKALLGTEAVALYSAAEALYLQVQMFNPLQIPMQTLLAGATGDRTRFSQVFARGSKYATLLYLITGSIAALAAPPFVAFFFPKYLPALPIFYILLATIPLQGISSALQLVFYALKSQRALFRISLLKIAGVLAISPIFILAFGIVGVAFEISITFILLVWLRYRVVLREAPEIRFSARALFTFDAYDRMFLRQLYHRMRRRGA